MSVFTGIFFCWYVLFYKIRLAVCVFGTGELLFWFFINVITYADELFILQKE